RYKYTDFAMGGALRNLPLVKRILLTYDIACQYSIHFAERFQEEQFAGPVWDSIRETVTQIQMLVPKLHLKGHIDDCQFRWALNFAKWTGQTCGELIEGVWSEQKQAGGMTKEMNGGHHHDVLNDLNNWWNWMKVQTTGMIIEPDLRHYSHSPKLRPCIGS
ncbi:hypothetical protein C8J56DRAFT_800545, partial [Mycena floridula]